MGLILPVSVTKHLKETSNSFGAVEVCAWVYKALSVARSLGPEATVPESKISHIYLLSFSQK